MTNWRCPMDGYEARSTQDKKEHMKREHPGMEMKEKRGKKRGM